MSNPPSINSRNNRFGVLHPAGDCRPATPVRLQTEQVHSKIERGIRLNSMQKDFLEKFENMQRDARDLSCAFTQRAAANELIPGLPNLVEVKKISEK